MKQGRSDKMTTAHKTAHPTVHKVSPAGVSQFGYATGDKLRPAGGHTGVSSSVPVKQGKGFEGPTPPPQRPGPGGGRTVHKSGSQGKH